MAKFIVTLVVETPRSKAIPSKTALKNYLLRATGMDWDVRLTDKVNEAYYLVEEIRVQSVDLD